MKVPHLRDFILRHRQAVRQRTLTPLMLNGGVVIVVAVGVVLVTHAVKLDGLVPIAAIQLGLAVLAAEHRAPTIGA